MISKFSNGTGKTGRYHPLLAGALLLGAIGSSTIGCKDGASPVDAAWIPDRNSPFDDDLGIPFTRLEEVTVIAPPGRPNNVEIRGTLAYASLGEAGLAVVDLTTRALLMTIPPPAGTQTIDDLCAADGLLFVLDATIPGYVSAYSLANPQAPQIIGGPVRVGVGSFSGISAGGGRVVVAGGVSGITVHQYSAAGVGAQAANISVGIEHPAVQVGPGGSVAYVSTGFNELVDGRKFGISVLALSPPPTAPQILAQFGLAGAGQTAGALQPASFPLQTALQGTLLFAAHGGGLSAIDVSNTQRPNPGTTGQLTFTAVSVAVVGDRAFVVGSSSLGQLDLSDPSTIHLLQLVTVEVGKATGVAANQQMVAVAANAGGLLLYPR